MHRRLYVPHCINLGVDVINNSNNWWPIQQPLNIQTIFKSSSLSNIRWTYCWTTSGRALNLFVDDWDYFFFSLRRYLRHIERLVDCWRLDQCTCSFNCSRGDGIINDVNYRSSKPSSSSIFFSLSIHYQSLPPFLVSQWWCSLHVHLVQTSWLRH